MSFPLFVEPPREEWQRLLADWAWLVDGPCYPLAATLFGDAFLLRPSGEVQLLDALEGNLKTVAPSLKEFEALLKSEQGRELLMAQMAELLWNKEVRPQPDECYGYQVPPIFGGSLGSENIRVFSRLVYMSIQGQLHRQAQGG
ncbi:DUF1851 domain-containing protein [Corallococcus sp. AB011P]|uniref:T6SS immunity protein Tdi1 domain-containing protein n=1 Tax=unclassified Corallococcus TaxID=2685029 RepID=UPI000EA31FE1|nr:MULTISPECIES: T6SS immunity protein Tdi1 domain-containing protein [unclassified Corallococcus]RKG51584.1 DUF1851 domain-containing protein [Corallococcus sp. AB011P]RKH83689.1 DUF1851 domain-containing protein [Corallococcus sp. AB045]